jgi:predicted SnoaL-like aldol condensation-catalyzing enzyme
VAARASDENRETVEAFFDDLVNEQDLEAANDLIAPDFVWNTPFAPPGRDGFVAFYPAIFEAFPDVQRAPELIVSDNDLVFVLNRITGTHLGGEALYGIPPSGNPIDYQSADIFRLDDGVIVELWDVADYLTLFTQIGLLPPAS